MGFRAPKPNDLVRDALQFLKLKGIRAFRQNTGATKFGTRYVRFGSPGAPDILCILPAHGAHPAGRLGCIEAKTGTGRLTPDQTAWLAAARAAGALVLVVRSVQELEHELSELMKEPTP